MESQVSSGTTRNQTLLVVVSKDETRGRGDTMRNKENEKNTQEGKDKDIVSVVVMS